MNKVEDIESMDGAQVEEMTVLGYLAVLWEETQRQTGVALRGAS